MTNFKTYFMKKTILFLFTTLIFNVQAQQVDYSLAKSGEYTLGVHIFLSSTPVSEYDFVAKIKKFDFYKIKTKDLEKILKKAKKKNPDFDGMIFKKDYDFIELIKFKSKPVSYAGFSLGEKVQFTSFGRIISGTIVDFIPARQRVVVKYTDPEGNEKLDGIGIKNLNKATE